MLLWASTPAATALAALALCSVTQSMLGAAVGISMGVVGSVLVQAGAGWGNKRYPPAWWGKVARMVRDATGRPIVQFDRPHLAAARGAALIAAHTLGDIPHWSFVAVFGVADLIFLALMAGCLIWLHRLHPRETRPPIAV